MAQLERSFKVSADEGEIQRRLSAFASQTGYDSKDGRTYRRGKGLGNLLAGFPRNTPAEIAVSWRRDPDDWQLQVEARLNAGGRNLPALAVDLEYWSTELDILEQALTGRTVNYSDLKNYAKSARMRHLLIWLVLVFFIVLGGTLARIIFDNPAAFWMGGAFGAMIGFGMVSSLTRRPLRKPLSSIIKDLPATPLKQPDASLLEMAMRRDIRSWGGWMIVLGIISFISAGFLDSAWGILLVVVGLGSFVFRTPALYIVYGITLVWAAINNALLSSGAWAVFSLVQLVMAVQIFGQFRRFNAAYQAGLRQAAKPTEAAPSPEPLSVENAPAPTTPGDGVETQPAIQGEPTPQQAYAAARIILERPLITPDPNAPLFSWLSLAMGFFGLFALLAVLGFTILQAVFIRTANVSPELLTFLNGVATDFCLLGFSAGLGSLLARHRFKGAAIAGLIMGGLGIAIILTLMVLARLG